MAKSIKLEDWQMERHQMGLKGKGTSGKLKFQGSAQDFSEKIDLRPAKKKAKKRPKMGGLRKKSISVFQYLKNMGMHITHIEIPCTGRFTSSGVEIKSMSITVRRFLWENQIRRDYPNALTFWYSKDSKEHETSNKEVRGDCSTTVFSL